PAHTTHMREGPAARSACVAVRTSGLEVASSRTGHALEHYRFDHWSLARKPPQPPHQPRRCLDEKDDDHSGNTEIEPEPACRVGDGLPAEVGAQPHRARPDDAAGRVPEQEPRP